jgi:hypothetical protein
MTPSDASMDRFVAILGLSVAPQFDRGHLVLADDAYVGVLYSRRETP